MSNPELPRVVDLGKNSVAIVGAGLVGCLLGIYLRKFHYSVHIFESRPDPRKNPDAGRSINLVLTSRGIAALTEVSEELAGKVMAVTVPVFGRVLHTGEGEASYQAYGPDASYCNFSVSRWELNVVLLSAAEAGGCHCHFSHPLQHLDVPRGELYFYLQAPSSQLYQKRVRARHVFGADGGGSRVRQALAGLAGSDQAVPLGYGYKELSMRPGLDPAALHIWPRGSHFLMGLPNKDASFTMTLYLPDSGPLSFASLASPPAFDAFFRQHYADALPHMPDCAAEAARNPVGFLGTVYMQPWVWTDRLALIGDAAHAITPFFGQGCNSGFEDVAVLARLLQGRTRMTDVFASYEKERKVNADAIAAMALDNFEEMMKRTADPQFLAEKAVEEELARRHPAYVPRYVLVTHSLIPYDLCRRLGDLQSQLLAQVARPGHTDWDLAARLVDSLLVPFMAKHNISPANFLYTSKYYPKARV